MWVDGALVAVDEARISPFDHGLLVGDGVFETIRVYGGEPFAWTRHLDRLAHSVSGLGLRSPIATPCTRPRARCCGPTATTRRACASRSPAASHHSARNAGSAGPTVVVASSTLRPWPDSVSVVIVPWVRNDRGATAGLKTTSYAENVRALAYAHERGASEAIFANTRDELCEATGSNVFVVRDGKVATPPGSSGCLLGVTRALVLELAEAAGIEVDDSPLSLDALRDADEAFLTSTTREVQPVSHVDDRGVPAVPGPVAATLSTAFNALVAQHLDP